jgi:hypothetical protein
VPIQPRRHDAPELTQDTDQDMRQCNFKGMNSCDSSLQSLPALLRAVNCAAAVQAAELPVPKGLRASQHMQDRCRGDRSFDTYIAHTCSQISPLSVLGSAHQLPSAVLNSCCYLSPHPHQQHN